MSVLEEFKSNFYRKGTKRIQPIKVIMCLILFLGLIAFAVFKEKDLAQKSRERKESLRYTIGITGKVHKNFKSSKPTVDYYYKYYRDQYSGTHHVGASNENNLISNGGRYYVEFSFKNPKNSELLLDYPVQDSILTAPPNGWDYIPGYR
ncbi:MAG: hypothetical protein AAB221_02750 [Bacteroidota bacterium]